MRRRPCTAADTSPLVSERVLGSGFWALGSGLWALGFLAQPSIHSEPSPCLALQPAGSGAC
ncbi:hypothetical protein BKA56DRAFT_579639 [Ilyonectria sp. MPI-CAGE-AT-0026]|nr:hypothetical protein BKA56DRAFT_579639 [Ilyonectria sp. MPI-CAGE-AT-0026]